MGGSRVEGKSKDSEVPDAGGGGVRGEERVRFVRGGNWDGKWINRIRVWAGRWGG
jgi:hypothetical protein